MTDHALTHARPPAGRRRRDWVPLALTICVWLCALPFVFLLIAPWLGLRAAVLAALALLPIIAVACWALSCGSHAPRGPSSGKDEP